MQVPIGRENQRQCFNIETEAGFILNITFENNARRTIWRAREVNHYCFPPNISFCIHCVQNLDRFQENWYILRRTGHNLIVELYGNLFDGYFRVRN